MNAMKIEAEKQLTEFRELFHNLLAKYPEIRLCGDNNGDILAIRPDGSEAWPHLYMPTSGKQELISK